VSLRERWREKDGSIGYLSWLNLTFGQGSPSLLPSPSPSLVPFSLNSVNQKSWYHEPPGGSWQAGPLRANVAKPITLKPRVNISKLMEVILFIDVWFFLQKFHTWIVCQWFHYVNFAFSQQNYLAIILSVISPSKLYFFLTIYLAFFVNFYILANVFWGWYRSA
jgi:hypothetical protein